MSKQKFHWVEKITCSQRKSNFQVNIEYSKSYETNTGKKQEKSHKGLSLKDEYLRQQTALINNKNVDFI